ncbi:MAG: CHASE2 domain-containing protein [Nostocaceae cyanobacterium]|nr:CHASE2 domain-containing protein [Nostocaceae cyanobacterium]
MSFDAGIYLINMLNNLTRILREEFVIWRVGLIPGLTVIALIIIARMTGTLQFLEWMAFDKLLRLRPQEPIDERVIIVGINEADIRAIKQYPIPDKELADLINKLQIYQPRVIGIDIFRDYPVQPGDDELVNTFKRSKNLVATEKALPPEIASPSSLPPQQIGFADSVLDVDGSLRRTLLGTNTLKGEFKLSLGLRLAKRYLIKENITLTNGTYDRYAMRFANTELPRIFPNTGAYVGADAGGVQTLINYRNSRFRVLSLQDIKQDKFSPRWIRDRVVIIGIMSPGVDIKNSPAMRFSEVVDSQQAYGVETQAHIVSQILSSVLDNRPLIKTWQEVWEYLWIISWGLLAIAFAKLTQSPLINFLIIGIAGTILILISYSLLLVGWWIPVVPNLLVFTLNGLGLAALYQYERALKSKIEERQFIIQHSYTTIHNGPLQTLGRLLQHLKEEEMSQNLLLEKMEKLNQEIRGVYDYLERESVSQNKKFYIVNGQVINLHDPIHSVLYQVYTYTLERDLLHFQTIKIKLPQFQPADKQSFSISQKRLLCQFLEESLCNVGKHAQGVTRLKVNFIKEQQTYILSVIDNGAGIQSDREGRGTEQFKNIARQLGGKFQRFSLPDNRGTVCQLSLPESKDWLAIGKWLMTM